jgi:hypothetical protein
MSLRTDPTHSINDTTKHVDLCFNFRRQGGGYAKRSKTKEGNSVKLYALITSKSTGICRRIRVETKTFLLIFAKSENEHIFANVFVYG